ncbi:hypothetical protein DEU50_109148 [Aeromonas salmonicida]|uniref:Uncharacterized protein n=1 Tax=Aeromonas salmonicida TaxID=645 RepID=A0AAX1PIB7_AERSA|nr:hypothetical protein DEU50_109148 [Aeromonas salmonicida]
MLTRNHGIIRYMMTLHKLTPLWLQRKISLFLQT